SISSQLKQLDKLDALLETTAGANEVMQLVQSTWDKAQAFKPQRPDQLSGGALFESLRIDALKLQPAQGSYTSLPITKAL
ncbi:hypothetical protein U2083_14380, partial [Listeria monocytogenes]|uniref:hypothetical protein n=1 Tax=Listeria monocytogenes TaxID=1639 RepID=UPI002FDBCAC3